MTIVLEANYEAHNNIDITLHVCRTGKKEQFYTLYVEGVRWGKYGASYWCNFVQNLSHSKTDAEQKARDYAKKNHYHTICHHLHLEVWDSPRPIYEKHEAFGIEMRMNKKRTIWYGHITPKFWDEWKKDKQAIKDAGYWVKKDGPTWLLFKRIDQDMLRFAEVVE